jgi:EpsI family protein
MRAFTPWRRFVPVALLLAAAAALLEARNMQEAVPSSLNLAAFPAAIGGWQGRDLPITPGEFAVLGPGQFLVRDYRRSAVEPPVNLYVAYFPSQRSGDTIHSPQNCLPGAGWAPVESGHFSLQRPDGPAISVNRYIIAKGLDRDLVLYWYQAHGRVTPSEYWAKIYLVADAIRMNRTDGALVRIVTPIAGGTDESVAQARALAFAAQALPLLDSYIPR